MLNNVLKEQREETYETIDELKGQIVWIIIHEIVTPLFWIGYIEVA